MKKLNQTSRRDKLRKLFHWWLDHTVMLQPMLDQLGISRQLMNKYVHSGWVERIGAGAYIRGGDKLDWLGAIYTLQYHLEYKCHIAGKTALELQGYAHYLPIGQGHRKTLLQHGSDKRPLPKWFVDYFIDEHIVSTHCVLFLDQPWDLGIIFYEDGAFHVKMACPERAILEYFYLLDETDPLEEGVQLLEGLTSLRPNTLQTFLETCSSIRVKRVFLVLAEYVNHPWWHRLNIEKIPLGKGKRKYYGGGHYHPKHLITK